MWAPSIHVPLYSPLARSLGPWPHVLLFELGPHWPYKGNSCLWLKTTLNMFVVNSSQNDLGSLFENL